MQAIWNVSITAAADQVVLFNMPVNTKEVLQDGRVVHAFHATPPMSSYLVAFTVGNLESVSRTVPYPEGKGSPRPVSIWGTPDR